MPLAFSLAVLLLIKDNRFFATNAGNDETLDLPATSQYNVMS